MNPIGGYYGLELAKGPYSYHTTPYTFKSGRSSLHSILRLLRPALVYIPFYTCNGLLESFQAANTPYCFYSINDRLEPDDLPDLEEHEYFLYINYFDIKRSFVNKLSDKYAGKLIVDCTQAFFMKGNGQSWFFNSCRKFFGVPDGSFLYAPDRTSMPLAPGINEQYTVEHLLLRFNGHTEEGYQAFLENELLCGTEITGMSVLSQYLLSNINYAEVIARRTANYLCLDKVLAGLPGFSPEPRDLGVPMVYPLLLHKEPDRKLFNSHRIYLPAFWADVLHREERGFDTEKRITAQLLPLPVDHRYDNNDMERMITLIKQSL
jgi:hypothetical protein